MKIYAIDPGNVRSALVVLDGDTLKPAEKYLEDNDAIMDRLNAREFATGDQAAIEMIASYGMTVGQTVFDTCVWIGRFYEAFVRKGIQPTRIYRLEEKIALCHSAKARDANIRRALIDRFAQHDLKNGRGTKKNPDWFYEFKADMWAAYAVGVTFSEKLKTEGIT